MEPIGEYGIKMGNTSLESRSQKMNNYELLASNIGLFYYYFKKEKLSRSKAMYAAIYLVTHDYIKNRKLDINILLDAFQFANMGTCSLGNQRLGVGKNVYVSRAHEKKSISIKKIDFLVALVMQVECHIFSIEDEMNLENIDIIDAVIDSKNEIKNAIKKASKGKTIYPDHKLRRVFKDIVKGTVVNSEFMEFINRFEYEDVNYDNPKYSF